MINSLYLTQCGETLEMFCNYMNEINYVINKVKQSIYEISNIKMPFIQVIVQNNVASLTVNGKKTLDQLKKIASILRGYSKSKNSQREEQQTRVSKLQYSSRASHSRLSKCTNCQSHFSKIERTTTVNGIDRQQNQEINMVTFQVPTPQNKRHHNQNDGLLMKRLKNHRSLRNLNRQSDTLSNNDVLGQNSQTTQFNNIFYSNIHNTSPISIHLHQSSPPIQHKRSRTYQKSLHNSSITRVLTQTENKFKQCIEKRDSDLNEIIKKHYQCLEILNDINAHLKNKKSKMNNLQSSPIQQLLNGGKISIGYKAMTPSNKKQNQILVR